MGDFTGKKSKRKQTAAMNNMNQMIERIKLEGNMRIFNLLILMLALRTFMLELKMLTLVYKTNLLDWKISMRVWKTVLKI